LTQFIQPNLEYAPRDRDFSGDLNLHKCIYLIWYPSGWSSCARHRHRSRHPQGCGKC